MENYLDNIIYDIIKSKEKYNNIHDIIYCNDETKWIVGKYYPCNVDTYVLFNNDTKIKFKNIDKKYQVKINQISQSKNLLSIVIPYMYDITIIYSNVDKIIQTVIGFDDERELIILNHEEYDLCVEFWMNTTTNVRNILTLGIYDAKLKKKLLEYPSTIYDSNDKYITAKRF